MNDAPLIVDEVLGSPNEPLVRCGYFYIDAEESLAEWTLGLDGTHYPFIMLGLAGILLGPSPGEEFNEPGQFQRTIERIEANPQLVVESGHLWLPPKVFRSMPRRGSLHRAPLPVFELALAYRNGRMSYPQFAETVLRFRGEIRYSEAETAALTAWTREVMPGRERTDRDQHRGYESPEL